MKKNLRSKILLCVLAGGVLYSPLTNVYAAELSDGPIFGKNDNAILGDDNYANYRTETDGVFTYDFQGDSQLNITAKDTTKYNGIYIMTDNKNSVKTININDKLDIILEKDHTKASLSGIIVSNVLSDKTIDRSAGGDITINIYNDETFGGPVISGAEISGLSNNKILLGDANITLNATNVKYGMSLHGLYVTNGNSNQINMGNGEIKITGNVKSESTNSATAEAYGMRVSGLGNTILTEDVSVDVNITGDQNNNLTMVSGINVMSGGKFDTGTGDIEVHAINKNNQPVNAYGILTANDGQMDKDGGKITAKAEGNGALAARGILSDSSIVNVGLVNVTTQAIGGNSNGVDSIGIFATGKGIANIAGGSITAQAFNSDGTTENVNANVLAVLSNGTSIVNVNQGTNNDVVINGDVETSSDAVVNLNLNTASSKFNGAVNDYSNNGTTLILSNGAEWNNTGASNLNTLSMDSGIINQNVDEDIAINNYYGTGDINFKAEDTDNNGVLNLANTGDVVICEAEKGSAVNLGVTNNTVNTLDIEKTEENLNAIAEKVSYIGTEGNLTGKVTVKEGLITPEASADLVFSQNGGGYVTNITGGNRVTQTMDAMQHLAETAIVAWRQEDSTLSQRLGELRESDGGQGIWVRMSRGEFEYDGAYKNQYNFFQMGYDWASGDWHYGAAVSHNDGQTTYTHGDGENRSTSLSLYGTWLGDKGHYADIVLKQGRLSNDFDIYTEAGHTSGDYDAWGTSLSGEYGMKVDLDGGWYVTPQAQLTLMRIGGEDYTTNNGIKVNQDSLESAVGRIGFEVGKRISDSGSIYAKASLLHDFAGSADTYLSHKGLTNSYHQDIGDTWCEAGIGFNYKTSKNSYVYADVVKTFGGDVETPWQWNAGMRWTF